MAVEELLGSVKHYVDAKRVSIAASTAANNTIVSAVTGKKIRVLSAFLVGSGANTAKFQDGAGGTDLNGIATFATGSVVVLPFNPLGWFETSAATLLNLALSTTATVGGNLQYIEV